MKKLIMILALPFLIYSCSEDNTTGIDNRRGNNNSSNPDTFFPLTLNASTTTGNIFESIQFTVITEKQCTLYDLKQSYDSLVWSVPEVNGRKKIFEYTYNSSKFSWSWGNCFYHKGKYHSVLTGYKDNKVILADTTIVNVDLNKKNDFLNIKWDDFKETFATEIVNNVFDSEFYMGVCRRVQNDTLYADVYFYPEDKIGKDDELMKKYTNERQEKIIIDYISELYKKPELSYLKNNEQLAAHYKKMFRVKNDSDVPRYLWKVGKTNIVLLYYKDAVSVDKYYLHVEPASVK